MHHISQAAQQLGPRSWRRNPESKVATLENAGDGDTLLSIKIPLIWQSKASAVLITDSDLHFVPQPGLKTYVVLPG